MKKTGKSWGVNRHTARYTSPVYIASQCKADVRVRAKETEVNNALWAMWLGKDSFLLML